MSENWTTVNPGKKKGQSKKKPNEKARKAAFEANSSADVLQHDIGTNKTIYERAEERKAEKEKRGKGKPPKEKEDVTPPAAVAAAEPNGKKKKSKRPKPPKTSAPAASMSRNDNVDELRAMLAELDADHLKATILEAKDRLKGKRELVFEHILMEVQSQAHAIPTVCELSWGGPISACPDAFIKVLLEELRVGKKAELEAFFEKVLVGFVDSVQKERAAAGFQLLLQAFLLLQSEQRTDCNFCASSLKGVLDVFQGAFPEEKILLPLFWVYNHAARDHKRDYIYVWCVLMLDALRDPKASKRSKAKALAGIPVFLKDVQKTDLASLGRTIKMHAVFNKMLAVVSGELETPLSEEQRAVVGKLLPVVRRCLVEDSVVAEQTFRNFLANLNLGNAPARQSEQLFILFLCLHKHDNCLSALETMFRKHVHQSGTLLGAIVRNQDRFRPSLCNRKEFIATLQNIDGQAAEQIEQVKDSKMKDYLQWIRQTCRDIVANEHRRLQAQRAAQPFIPLWLLVALLATCTLLLIVLTSHFVCRFSLDNLSAAKEPCHQLEKIGFLRGVDNFYTNLTPLQAYARPAMDKVSEAWTLTQPYRDQVGSYCALAWEKSEPTRQAITEAVGPAAAVVADKANELWLASKPYASEAADAAVSGLDTAWQWTASAVEAATPVVKEYGSRFMEAATSAIHFATDKFVELTEQGKTIWQQRGH